VNFVEPMVTKAFLETKPNITIPLKQPAAFPKRGYYPTSYSMKYDATRQEYTVSLDGLTLRHGTQPKVTQPTVPARPSLKASSPQRKSPARSGS
jgi:hypothetical protein